MPEPSDIHDHLLESRWRDRFEDEVLLVAGKLKGKVRALRCDWEGDQFVIHADIAGESCEIIHWQENGRWDFESQCPCEIRSYCPHAAAALLVASKPAKLRDLLQGTRDVPAVPHNPAAPATPKPADHPALTTRQGGKAAFHLRITREPTASKVVRLLLQALKIPDLGDWVVARPFAIYDKHRIPLAGTAGPREYRLETPEGPVVLRRDVAAEMNAIQLLQQTGLASLSSHDQYRFLLALQKTNPKAAAHNPQFLWFPNPGHGTLAEFWPWLRATGGPLLEAAGWSVSFDDNVGHEVIDLDPDNFTYTLEDDGSGWFHLSVGFEVAGSQLDLLPILAQLLDRGAMETTLEFPADGHIRVPSV